MYAHLVLFYIAIEVELTCENAAKKGNKVRCGEYDITITIHKSFIKITDCYDATTVKEAVVVTSY